MATQTQATVAKAELTGEQKIEQLRELFADATDVGKAALENVIKELSSQVSEPPPPIESAGRVGARLGKRSELTIVVPLVPGGAKRLPQRRETGLRRFRSRTPGRSSRSHAGGNCK